jgi:hypothetical protein
MISEPVVRSAQIVHLSCFKISTICKWNQKEPPLEPRHLGVPSGVPKMISERMVRLVQIGLQTCTDTKTISKRTELRFHTTQVT